jgi:hypothetical protein
VNPAIACRLWSISLDFKSVNALKKFYEAFDDKIVQLDEKVIMKLHFEEVRGNTEPDWFKAFYGTSKAKSTWSHLLTRLCTRARPGGTWPPWIEASSRAGLPLLAACVFLHVCV